MDNKKYLPWIEKYRPDNINDIIGQKTILNCLKKMLKNNSLPHMLFYGISGTGKTSTVLSLARELYGDNFTFMVMKLDASDDRGINSVREEIKGFAEKKTLFNKGIKLIILDEVDSMTFDAQFALRRIIEKYSDTTRFCLICNYEHKIISAIKCRCANFRFSPIGIKSIEKKLENICEKENLEINKKAIKSIAKISKGDLRKAINFIQSISMRSCKIDIDLCYETAGIPPPKVIKKIYDYLLDKKLDFNKTYKYFEKYIKNQGYSLSIILKEFTNYLVKNCENIENKHLVEYFSKLSDLEEQVAYSTFSDIYISSFIGIFK